jgi:hypothetical protein
MGLFNRKKRPNQVSSGKKNRLGFRLQKKVRHEYIVDCDIIFKGKPISRIDFKTIGYSGLQVRQDFNKDISFKVVKVNRVKSKK